MCSYVTWFEKRCELIESPQATAEQFRSTGMWGLGGSAGWLREKISAQREIK